MLAVTGLNLALMSPSVPTFTDVPRGSAYYEYVEGAHASGLVQGLGGGLYGPDLPVARQQVATILARYLSGVELSVFGHITGTQATYANLNGWYAAEGQAQLAAFADWPAISFVHRAGVAYLAMHDIALGSNGLFSPRSSVTVSQSVAFIARTAEVAGSFSAAPEPVAPAVTSISPSMGPYSGGTTVQIHGTGFTSGATVRFGSAMASSVTVTSSTLIVAVSPPGTAGSTVQVSVSTAAGTSANTSADDFTYSAGAVPTVTSLSSNYGWAGNVISIYGTNFSLDGLQVWFGSVQIATSQVGFISSTRVDVVVPSGSAGQTVNVKVATAYGISSNTPADDFTYYSGYIPSITALVPDFGWEGDVISIHGTNFVYGGTAVYFGTEQVSYADITYYGTTHLAVAVPQGVDGQTVRVRVVTAAGTSPNTPADDFTYVLTDDPIVTDVSPDHGWEGDLVTIYGHNFTTSGLEVWFGSEQVDPGDITYYSSTKLKVIVPPGFDGQTVRVAVVTVYGVSANSPADDFTYVAPGIVVAGIGSAEWSVAGLGDWHSSHSAAFFDGTFLDFRMQVVDQYGDPVVLTNVSELSPWLKWYPNEWPRGDTRPSGDPGGEPPVSTITDANGYLYWLGEGGYSHATFTFELRLGPGFGFHPQLGEETFTLTWGS